MRKIFVVLCAVVLTVFAGCGNTYNYYGSDVTLQADNSGLASDMSIDGPMECETNADCDDHDSCTYDACNHEIGKCDNKVIQSCLSCKPEADDPTCDDHNTCTTDKCVRAAPTDNVGRCEYAPVEGCVPSK